MNRTLSLLVVCFILLLALPAAMAASPYGANYKYYWQYSLSSAQSIDNYQVPIRATASNFDFTLCPDFSQIAWSYIDSNNNEVATPGTILKISDPSAHLLVAYVLVPHINGPNSASIRLYCNWAGAGAAPNLNNPAGVFPSPYIHDEFSSVNPIWQNAGFGTAVSGGSTSAGVYAGPSAAFATPLRFIVDMTPGQTISANRPDIGLDPGGPYPPCASLTADLSILPAGSNNGFDWYTQNGVNHPVSLGESVITSSGNSVTINPPARAVYEAGASPTDSYLSQDGNLLYSGTGQTCDSPVNYLVLGSGNAGSDNPTVYQVATAKYAYPPPTVTTTGQSFALGHITLTESVTNAHGGTAAPNDFGLSIDGTPVASGSTTDVDSNAPHTIGQAGLPGYALVSITGDSACPSVLGGSITLSPGQIISCTIASADQPGTLTVVQHVVNAHGGTASASGVALSASGSSPSPASFSGSESGTPVTLNAGAYSVAQTSPPGYTSSLSSDCSGTMGLGQSKTCTVTSTDVQPLLTVNVLVQNSHGATATVSIFTPHVGASTVASGASTGFDAGAYSVTEDALKGYSIHYSGACDSTGHVALSVGDVKACTITNIDDVQPTLTVTTVVVNQNGGTHVAADFPLFVNGQPVTSGAPNTLAVGPDAVTQTVLSGYIATYSGDCDSSGHLAMLPGDSDQCTITDVDGVAPTLKVIAVVNNAHGGTLTVSQVNLLVDSAAVTSGVAVSLAHGTHTVSQISTPGYAGTITGDCAADGTVSLLPGDAKTCTLTNNDIQPKLTVTGVVSNTHGGTATPANFAYNVGSTPVSSGASNGFDSGAYVVSQTGPSGYSAAFSGDCNANGQVALSIGNVKACTITFSDIAPTLTVIKHVVNQNLFSCTQSRDDLSKQMSRHNLPSPSADDLNKIMNLKEGDEFGLQLNGRSYRVEKHNDQIQVHDSDDDSRNGDHHGGTISASSFTLQVSGPAASPSSFKGSETGTPVTLSAGTYGVSETGPAGYAPSFSSDCSGAIGVGQSKTCTLTNTFSPTRGQGFWATHFALASSTWASISNKQIGSKTAATAAAMEGGFWANIAKTSTGSKRSALDQARMQCLQQMEAAMLNVQAFGVSDGGLIAKAKTDFAGSNANAILSDASALDAFNNGGSTLPSALASGAANPDGAQDAASKAFWDALP